MWEWSQCRHNLCLKSFSSIPARCRHEIHDSHKPCKQCPSNPPGNKQIQANYFSKLAADMQNGRVETIKNWQDQLFDPESSFQRSLFVVQLPCRRWIGIQSFVVVGKHQNHKFRRKEGLLHCCPWKITFVFLITTGHVCANYFNYQKNALFGISKSFVKNGIWKINHQRIHKHQFWLNLPLMEQQWHLGSEGYEDLQAELARAIPVINKLNEDRKVLM